MTARRVSVWELAAFALPAAPLLALTLPTVIFLPPYYATHLGLPLWAVSAIFVGARVFDIVIDPGLGAMQDQTKTRWGRRRVWIVGTTPFLMGAIWWVFIGLAPGAGIATAGAATFALYFFFAVMFVAHLGWAGEIIPTYHGRTHALGAVQVASLAGQVLMLVIGAVVAQGQHGNDARAVAAMGWTLFAMLPITVAIAVFGARETPTPPQPNMKLGDALRTLAANEMARRVLLPDLLLGVAQGVSGGLFLFYFQYVLGFARESQALVAIYFIAGFIGVPIWWLVARRFGKDRALQASLLYSALTMLPLLVLQHGGFAIAAGLMIIAGLAQGGNILLTRALMADVVDEDELQTNMRRSGLYFGLLQMTSKTGLAAGPLCLVVLQLFGFEAGLGPRNSETALAALSVLFIGVPILLFVLAAISLRKYPLDEARQAALAAAISARHAQNSENT
ncbi:MAG TPA: MFS transporter [Caulobacterales bacterium]|nr:MFS transporter [Caulobacterales bacterium]